MFGGAGVYCQGVMFALIAGEELYLKADDNMQKDLDDLGCGPFMVKFDKWENPRPMKGYWAMPESASSLPPLPVLPAKSHQYGPFAPNHYRAHRQ